MFNRGIMRSETAVKKILATAITRIEKHIDTRLMSSDIFVRRFLQHTAATRGKRLRARLVVLSAAATGRLHPRVERLAAAMELLHQATLVHDDVIDQAEQRRHRVTLNARFGNETAVLVGDYLFAQSMNLLLDELPTPVGKIVAKAATQVCFGEIQEMKFLRNIRMKPVEYLEMISNKTASLLAASCEAGAMAAQAKPGLGRSLAEYGRAFGMAFQIQDDILDVVGKKKKVGKPVGLDVKDGRVTLPMIYGLDMLRGAQRQALVKELKSRKPRMRVLRTLLEAGGAMDRCRALATSYAKKAEGALRVLPMSEAKRQMLELVQFAVERDH